jgi:sterol desaturase/sphingolipid hydroxylase (fatty acid hydroxylase superfamily)
MQPVDYIALAIPVFFALIGVEWLYARLRAEKLYRLNDSVNDLATGILDQVLGVFTKAVTVGVYAWVWDRFRISEWNAGSPWTWVLCFLGVDFFYYWFHRVSHESNLPWGAHIVHHSSEEFNLSVALRQGAFQPLFSFPFYLPLAWLGFSPLVFLACSSFDTLYQFWIHTRAIDKLGPLEWIFNTPSHHRVHHGCDAKYIDKNYAGTLIVWDRMFGSFQPEEEEPVYGITKPLSSWNPLWANVHHYVDLARASRSAPSAGEAAKLWLKGPGWQPAWVKRALYGQPFRTPLIDGEAAKYDARPARPLVPYALAQFATALGGTLVLLHLQERLAPAERLGLALAIAWTVLDVGLLFDRRRAAVPVELLRLAALWAAGAAWAATRLSGPVFGAAVVGALVGVSASAAWLLHARRAGDPPAAPVAGESSTAAAG